MGKIKLEEQQYFATRDFAIANAKKKSDRTALIKNLLVSQPHLWFDYTHAVHNAECESKFVRFSKRFELSAIGDINTYLLFTELSYRNKNPRNGRTGLIIPIGLVAESSSKLFFEYLARRILLKVFMDL